MCPGKGSATRLPPKSRALSRGMSGGVHALFSLRLGHGERAEGLSARPSYPPLFITDSIVSCAETGGRAGGKKQSLHENLRFGAPGGLLGGVGGKGILFPLRRGNDGGGFGANRAHLCAKYPAFSGEHVFFFPARRFSPIAKRTFPRAEFRRGSAGRVADGGKVQSFLPTYRDRRAAAHSLVFPSTAITRRCVVTGVPFPPVFGGVALPSSPRDAAPEARRELPLARKFGVQRGSEDGVPL